MKRDIKNGTLAIVITATILVFLFCFIRSCSVEATYPIQRAKRTFSDKVACRIKAIFSASRTSQENIRLKREAATLAMIAGDCGRLEEENARLRKVLEYKERDYGKWLAADVLSEGGGAAGARKTIRVGKGSLAGIKTGAAVAVPDGLVGRVVSVTPSTAEVLLITDPSLKVSCSIDGEGVAKGILSGGTDELLVMRHFSVGSKVTAGSKVFTTGLGGIFPAGIPVGTLQGSVRQDAGELLRECEVQPAVDFSTLEDVFIRSDEK